MLTPDEAAILRAVAEGRAVWANEHGPALSRRDFSIACGMAMRNPPLTRAIRRSEGGPRLELTDAGRAALQNCAPEEGEK